MHVLCKFSNTVSDVRCRVCGQGFLVHWSHVSGAEQEAVRRQVLESLEEHHSLSIGDPVHPRPEFSVMVRQEIRSLATTTLVAQMVGGAM